MSDQRNAGEQVTGAAEPVPPPAPALMNAVRVMQPVRTRRPWLATLLVLAAAALRPVHSLLTGGLRPDFWDLPALWRALAPLVWAAGLLFVLRAATLPRRGSVLPDVAAASRATWATAAALIAFGLFATVDAPTTVVPPAAPRAFAVLWWHCTSYSVLVVLPPLLVGGFLLRRLFPLGAGRVAAALGAAAGAAAGLTLHFICPVGGSLHVGFAHAGAVVVGAGLGALLLGRVLRA